MFHLEHLYRLRHTYLNVHINRELVYQRVPKVGLIALTGCL